MFSQPNLSQSQQPNAHYDYDGLSGTWLRLPWWVHIGVAMLAWPLSWWGLPMLPVKNPNISEFLVNYRMQIASATSILTIMTALLSYLKARKIQNRKTTKKVVSAQKNTKKVQSKKSQVETEKPKAKKHSTSTRKTASKMTDAQVEKKPTVKKTKTTIKKKSDQQARLDF